MDLREFCLGSSEWAIWFSFGVEDIPATRLATEERYKGKAAQISWAR